MCRSRLLDLIITQLNTVKHHTIQVYSRKDEIEKKIYGNCMQVPFFQAFTGGKMQECMQTIFYSYIGIGLKRLSSFLDL